MSRSRAPGPPLSQPPPPPPPQTYVFRPRSAIELTWPWFDQYRPCLLPHNKNRWAVEMRTESGTVYLCKPTTRLMADYHLHVIRNYLGITDYTTDERREAAVREWWPKQNYTTQTKVPEPE